MTSSTVPRTEHGHQRENNLSFEFCNWYSKGDGVLTVTVTHTITTSESDLVEVLEV